MDINNRLSEPKKDHFSQTLKSLFSTNTDAMLEQYDPYTINAVWEKASKEFGFYFFRRDHLGKIIAKHEFGKKNQYGWEIVQIVPRSNGGTNSIDNLLPLHWENVQMKGDR